MTQTAGRKSSGFQRLVSLRLDVLARLSDRHADIDYRRNVGLSLLQCRVLGVVGSHGEMTFQSAYRETGIEKSHASRIVASLISVGLLKKTSDPDDQRSIILGVTRRGAKVHKQVLRLGVDRNNRWLEPLSAEQREMFLDCIDLLTQQARKLAARTQSSIGGARPKGGSRADTRGSNRYLGSPVAIQKAKPRRVAVLRP